MPRESCKELRVRAGWLDTELGNAVFVCNLKPYKGTENWIHRESNPKDFIWDQARRRTWLLLVLSFGLA